MEEMNEDEQDIFINQLMNDVDRYKDIIDEQINFIGVIKQETNNLFILLALNYLEFFFFSNS